jgi:hypothetical protein
MTDTAAAAPHSSAHSSRPDKRARTMTSVRDDRADGVVQRRLERRCQTQREQFPAAPRVAFMMSLRTTMY